MTDDVARRLLSEETRRESVLLVVGDRVTKDARKLLVSLGSGYYDLRGRLALRSDRVVVNADVEPVTERTRRVDALGGKAGLEVATALLMEPGGAAVRRLARDLGRSSSTVSEILAVLRQDDLVGLGNAVTDSRLFWQVADRWAVPRTYLSRLPSLEGQDAAMAPLRLGLDDVEHETGWALTGSIAAAAQGAPVAVRSGQSLDLYVPDRAISAPRPDPVGRGRLRRCRRLLHQGRTSTSGVPAEVPSRLGPRDLATRSPALRCARSCAGSGPRPRDPRRVDPRLAVGPCLVAA